MKIVSFSEKDIQDGLKCIADVLRSGRLTLGPFVQQFEKAFSRYNNSRFCTATSSGTSALEIILRSCNVRGGDVLVPTNTFPATIFAIKNAGARPVFVESNQSMNISVKAMQKAITTNTKAIVVVHIGGFIHSEMREIQRICKKENIFCIEDAAHAHGSDLDGVKAGNFGIAGAFSFYPTKVMTTGEGGMIVTGNEDIYEKARIFRDQGKENFYSQMHIYEGYNWRMSELHAILGLLQVEKLNSLLDKRREIAREYRKHLQRMKGISILDVVDGLKPNYYKFIVFLDRGIGKERFKIELRERGIQISGGVYDIPCHLQPVFQNLGYQKGDFPIAEDLAERHFCLPISSSMEKKDIHPIVSAVEDVLKNR